MSTSALSDKLCFMCRVVQPSLHFQKSYITEHFYIYTDCKVHLSVSFLSLKSVLTRIALYLINLICTVFYNT